MEICTLCKPGSLERCLISAKFTGYTLFTIRFSFQISILMTQLRSLSHCFLAETYKSDGLTRSYGLNSKVILSSFGWQPSRLLVVIALLTKSRSKKKKWKLENTNIFSQEIMPIDIYYGNRIHLGTILHIFRMYIGFCK